MTLENDMYFNSVVPIPIEHITREAVSSAIKAGYLQVVLETKGEISGLVDYIVALVHGAVKHERETNGT